MNNSDLKTNYLIKTNQRHSSCFLALSNSTQEIKSYVGHGVDKFKIFDNNGGVSKRGVYMVSRPAGYFRVVE